MKYTRTPVRISNLNNSFTNEEMYRVVHLMKGMVSLGPCDIPAMLYHHFLNIIRNDIFSTILDIINKNGDPAMFNHTYICLITKKTKPQHC